MATVHIEIEANSQADASDGITNLLGTAYDRGEIAEWQYAQFGHQWLHPTEGSLPNPDAE